MNQACWRLLNVAYDDPHRNVALEEAILRSVGSGAAPSTLRFWRNRRAVVIGAFQSPDLEVDLDACAAEAIPVIRRISGGGAVYHDEGVLNYSLFSPKRHPIAANGFRPVFKQVGVIVTTVLRTLGVDADPPSLTTIQVGAHKISGLAGAVKHGAILVHGSLLIHANLSRLSRVLALTHPLPSMGGRRAFTRSQKMAVINLNDVLNCPLSPSDVQHHFRTAFENLLTATCLPGDITASEDRLLQTLYATKYRLQTWNFKYVTS